MKPTVSRTLRAGALALPLLLATAGGLMAQTPAAVGVEEPVELETTTGTLHGTLLLPEATTAPYPVVLIIAGSGPADRDGNTTVLPGKNNSLKLLAEGLAARGIASLRYDKRGIAGSKEAGPASEADVRFEMYVDDAAAWVRQLRGDERFSTVTVVGHSEGSLIGMIASRQAGASGFVSIAGPGRRADLVILDQLRMQAPPLAAEAERIFATLTAGSRVDSVPPMLAVLFRPSVQPYLISWLRYDPAREIAKLSTPVLIAQGTTDMQVKAEEAQILASASPAARLLVVEGMNHVLKAAPLDYGKQVASYGDPSLPVVPQLIEAIGDFVRAIR